MSTYFSVSLVAAASLLLSACAAENHDTPMPDPSRFIEKHRAPRQSEGPDAPPPGTVPLFPSFPTSATVAACFAIKQAGSNIVVPDLAARRSTEALLGQALTNGSANLRVWIGPLPESDGPGSIETGGWFDETNLDTLDKQFLAARYGEAVMAASGIDGWFFRSSDAICAAQLTVEVSGTEAERICGAAGLHCRLVCDASGCREATPARR